MAKKQTKKSIKPHELAELLHDVFEKERSHKLKKQQKISTTLYKLRKAISIPIIIGIFAAVLMWKFYGWDNLARTLLSWTIGLTILAAIITLLERVDRV